jgi:hypothetical protein
MCGGGRHICGGVFGRINDPNIVYLGCRNVEGAAKVDQWSFGATGSTQIMDKLDETAETLMKLSEEEAGRRLCQMEDAKDPDAQELLANLILNDDLRKAAYKERTRRALATMDAPTFAAMFNGQPAEEQGWMREIPATVETLEKADKAKKPKAFSPKSSQ